MADPTGTYAVVFITASSSDEARLLAETLVSEGLAACVNTVNQVQSTYLWEGRLERSEEYLLICKTRIGLFDRLENRVRSLHSYRVPEIIQIPITDGSEAYLKWMDGALAP